MPGRAYRLKLVRRFLKGAAIGRDQGPVSLERLGNQHTVERVTMEAR